MPPGGMGVPPVGSSIADCGLPIADSNGGMGASPVDNRDGGAPNPKSKFQDPKPEGTEEPRSPGAEGQKQNPQSAIRNPQSKPSRFGRTLLLLLISHASAAAIGAGLLFHYQPRWLTEWLYPRPRTALEVDPLRTPPSAYFWNEQPPAAFPVPPYARFLKGVTIVLDPGHVGQRDPGGGWKRGPTGLREAVVNLNVATFLADFLRESGAKVILTRDHDESLNLDDDVDLLERAEVANRANADLLLSIHHNAAEAPEANHTLLFYHARPEDSPAALCVARHLLTGLDDALRLDRIVDCALQSDYIMYQNGFAVLRHARVPAVLSESSFHSNPEQEQRLRDPVYNRREAYGLFLGLARWAQAGLPRVRLIEASDGKPTPGGTLVVQLDDGLTSRAGKSGAALMPDTLSVELDGEGVAYEQDAARGELRITLPTSMPAGLGYLKVDFQNIFGQPVLHPWIALSDTPPPRPQPPPAASKPGSKPTTKPGVKPANKPATKSKQN